MSDYREYIGCEDLCAFTVVNTVELRDEQILKVIKQKRKRSKTQSNETKGNRSESQNKIYYHQISY